MQMGWAMGILLFIGACIDPFEVEFTESARLLVVEGLVTDGPGPYEVQLSWSAPLDSGDFDPATQAAVQVEEQESGTLFQFTETEPGRYHSDSLSFRGQVGRHYRLRLTTREGEAFDSDWMLLKAAPEIDSLYFRYEEKTLPSGDIKGIQLLLDTNDPEGNSRFYRWKWEEAWEYSTPYTAGLEYLGNNQVEPIPLNGICYQQASSTQISLDNTTQSTEDAFIGHPLHFVDIQSNRLQRRYSIEVQQLVMEENEFLFWKLIQESTENVGSLFDRQPQSQTGNISHQTDPDINVLGYFSASGEARKRIFIDRADALPQGTIVEPQFVSDCNRSVDTLRIASGQTQAIMDELIDFRLSRDEVFFTFLTNPLGAIIGYIFTTPACSDCTVRGGSLEQPEFWIE